MISPTRCQLAKESEYWARDGVQRYGALEYARLEATSPTRPTRVWLGVGITSANGLPFDTLSMLLLAGATGAVTPDQPLEALIADQAVRDGAVCDPNDIAPRIRNRRDDITRIARAMNLPVIVRLESELMSQAARDELMREIRECLNGINDPVLTPYVYTAVADAIHFARRGFWKIGWVADPSLKRGVGRFDEFNGSDFWARLVEPAMTAIYTRPGVTFDPTRPRAVPYTEPRDTTYRLMLTGETAGNFKKRIADKAPKPKHVWPVIGQVERITSAWERRRGELEGDDSLDKAESIFRAVDAA